MENSVELVIMGQPPAELELEAVRFKTNPLVVVAPPITASLTTPYSAGKAARRGVSGA